METRILTAQNRTQRVPRPPHRSQHEPHQTQEENAGDLLRKVSSARRLRGRPRSPLPVSLQPLSFATGKSTGIVLDSGDGVTHVIPVYEGYSLAHSCERMDLAGRDVTSHLQNLLRKSGINLNTSAEFELVRTIKEKYCAISLTPLEKAREKKEKYTLPDGQQV